jgi:hypothetical protein
VRYSVIPLEARQGVPGDAQDLAQHRAPPHAGNDPGLRPAAAYRQGRGL